MTTTTLVIVESPAKCKKIEEYLGPGYKCVASYGHLRDIQSLKNINIEENFKPSYIIIDNQIKKKQIDFLRKEIINANDLILASDDDREGEAISWHICQLFNLDVNKTKRIVFNEITESAIQQSIKNAKTIDMNLVNAQQARQILDILVGFKVSPMLWKFIGNQTEKDKALSAGRCQTPALRLIYDNEEHIKNTQERNEYNITGYFTNLNLEFKLNKNFESHEDITNFLNGSKHFAHIYSCTNPIKVIKNPPEPFTTSRLQQVASNELHYSPKETMHICQSLYEEGYITYMRTDSKKYSKEFIENVKSYIIKTYDKREYINEQIDFLSKTEDKDKQEAHEAIRPTDIFLSQLPKTMESKKIKMYHLIWCNTLESCMSPSLYFSITATILAFQNLKYIFISESIYFLGWKIVDKKYFENKEYQYLLKIKQNSIIPYNKICCKETLKGIQMHYTEARLVQLLEEKGIGRPSTFSSLIDKIQERGYVKKEDIKGKEIICKDFELENNNIIEINIKREIGNEKNKLKIQPLGVIVMKFLENHFDELFNYDYTSKMENCLDKIANGTKIWYKLCEECNNTIDNLIKKLTYKTKFEIKIDENNTYIIGKYGPVIKNIEQVHGKEEIKFKKVKNDIDLKLLENGNYKLDEIIENDNTSQIILGKYNDIDVILKKGKFGIYIMWGENSKTLKEIGNRPIENITFEEVTKYLTDNNILREINDNLSIRKSKKGDYLFYKTSKMKKPQFYDIKVFNSETIYDYINCDITILKLWIFNKYKI